jgi:hypothetical protein
MINLRASRAFPIVFPLTVLDFNAGMMLSSPR